MQMIWNNYQPLGLNVLTKVAAGIVITRVVFYCVYWAFSEIMQSWFSSHSIIRFDLGIITGNWDVSMQWQSLPCLLPCLLREGNFQVLVILKWEIAYVDFCFLPNKCYHGIPSSYWWIFKRKSHNLRALIIILRARFWEKHYFQQNDTCRE